MLLCANCLHHTTILRWLRSRDGEEAIIRVASCQPDIILMDINMPKMGIEATTVIKKLGKDIVIIGLCMIQAFLKVRALAVVSKERLDSYSTIRRACANRRKVPKAVSNSTTEQS